MMRLLILAEGPTEQAFVSRVLAPHLWNIAQIDASAPCIETSRDKATGRTFRGGHARHYKHIRRHVLLLLNSNPTAFVTTLLDLYGLPSDFPGLAGCPPATPATCFQRALDLERAFADDIQNVRFIPNLVVHEFEGLLFTSPEEIDRALTGASRLSVLQKITQSFASPEEINDSPDTAPSKLLEKIYPGYKKEKPRLGPLIAEKIGLEAIRSRCQHFNAWLDRIEKLGQVQTCRE